MLWIISKEFHALLKSCGTFECQFWRRPPALRFHEQCKGGCTKNAGQTHGACPDTPVVRERHDAPETRCIYDRVLYSSRNRNMRPHLPRRVHAPRKIYRIILRGLCFRLRLGLRCRFRLYWLPLSKQPEAQRGSQNVAGLDVSHD